MNLRHRRVVRPSLKPRTVLTTVLQATGVAAGTLFVWANAALGVCALLGG